MARTATAKIDPYFLRSVSQKHPTTALFYTMLITAVHPYRPGKRSAASIWKRRALTIPSRNCESLYEIVFNYVKTFVQKQAKNDRDLGVRG